VNAKETGLLLARCASYDRRKVGDVDVIAWLQVLGDLPFADCEQAVIGHYADSTEWIMPAHVRQRVRELRNRRLDGTKAPAPPAELVDNPAAYQAALHAARVAIADGRDPQQAVEAVARTARRELGASS
jgi:hypothetical protein